MTNKKRHWSESNTRTWQQTNLQRREHQTNYYYGQIIRTDFDSVQHRNSTHWQTHTIYNIAEAHPNSGIQQNFIYASVWQQSSFSGYHYQIINSKWLFTECAPWIKNGYMQILSPSRDCLVLFCSLKSVPFIYVCICCVDVYIIKLMQ